MRLGIFLVVFFDEEEADTRLGRRCCHTAAVAEEEGSRLDLPGRAVAVEAGMIAEVEESQARSGEVGKIALGIMSTEIIFCTATVSSTRRRICLAIRWSCRPWNQSSLSVTQASRRRTRIVSGLLRRATVPITRWRRSRHNDV